MFAGMVSLEKMETCLTVWEMKSVTEMLSAVSESKVVELLQLWELQYSQSHEDTGLRGAQKMAEDSINEMQSLFLSHPEMHRHEIQVRFFPYEGLIPLDREESE